MEQEFNQEPNQPKITEEQKQSLLLQRQEKFKKMGIPSPQPPINPALVAKTGNPNMMSKLDEIKKGLKRGEFSQIIHQGEKKINEKQQQTQRGQQRKGNNPGQQQVSTSTTPPPMLFEEQPLPSRELDEMERILNGHDMGGGMPTRRPQGQSFDRSQLANSMNTSLEDDFEYNRNLNAKFYSSIEEKQRKMMENQDNQHMTQGNFYPPQPIQQPYSPQPVIGIPQGQKLTPGLVLVDEREIEQKIITIATQIAKKEATQIIKAVLNEYLKQTKNTIVESEKVKKAEVVGENIVKIEGKLYKLTPATIKKTIAE